MPAPRVSIVTPTHNRAELLRETIASVMAQTWEDWEMLIVDDGSTDGTREAVEGLREPRIRYFGLERTGNLSRLLNFGIAQALGEQVAFLDSDDLWREDKLQAQVEVLASHPEAGWCICGFESFNEKGPLRRNVHCGPGQEEGGCSVGGIFPAVIRASLTLFTSTLAVRRQAFDRAGTLNEELPIGDFELCTRLAFHYPAAVLHRPLVRIRKHSGNMTHALQAGMDGFAQAIHSVESFYAQGAIPRALHREMMLMYRYRLGRYLQKLGDPAAARREFLACLRLHPAHAGAWSGWAASLLRGRGNA
ncbi:MAG: hypothetical protein QOH06_733 [Acidobacteriota bacterium]|jgi:glycosyltransferase involved in cell wall biosynthesis|nr:hypothetical protein [Acidobacteriota bacterium]